MDAKIYYQGLAGPSMHKEKTLLLNTTIHHSATHLHTHPRTRRARTMASEPKGAKKRKGMCFAPLLIAHNY